MTATRAQKEAEEARKKEEAASQAAAAAAKETAAWEKVRAEREEAKAREDAKKARDAERKQEEETAKQKRRGAEEEAGAAEGDVSGKKQKDENHMDTGGEGEAKTAEDKPDAGINDYINEMNHGGSDDEKVEEQAENVAEKNGEEAKMEEEEQEIKSPAKKKKKKDKKKNKKNKEDGAGSILKQGKFAKAAEEKADAARAKVAAEEARKKYKHEFTRTIVEASLICKNEGIEAKFDEFTLGVRSLFKQIQKVDKKAAMDPIDADGERLWEPNDLPFDHTDLGAWIMKGGNKVFEMKKARKNDREEEDRYLDPEVYFTFGFSSDVDPLKIIDRISCEWGRIGGRRLMVKEISSFNTKTSFCLYHVRKDGTPATIEAELKKVLDEAQSYAIQQDDNFLFGLEDIPDLGLRAQMPKVEGMDTRQFQGWSWRQQELRKVLHVEVEEKHVEMVQCLVEWSKSGGIMQKYFGKNAHASNVIEVKKGAAARRAKDQKLVQGKVDMSALASHCRKHINFMGNTRYDGILGILDLDKPVAFYSASDPTKVAGYYTLRRAMYEKFKMADGHRLFWEVHQAAAMGPVDVVVPNCAEAERLVLMINKNAAAFFINYLRDYGGMPEDFVKRLVRATMDPSKVSSVIDCVWEKEGMVLTTKADEEAEELQAMEDAAWYKDEIGEHMEDSGKKKKKKYAGQEELEELSCDQSYKSVHHKKGKVARFSDGGEEDNEVEEVDADGNVIGREVKGTPNLSEMSKEELIELFRKQHISPLSAGSHPEDDNSKASSSSGNGEEDSDSSSSDSSSSQGVEDVTPAPSGGVKSGTSERAQGA